MLEWFLGGESTGSAGLERMRDEFGDMLDAGRHAFACGADAFLGGADPEAIREDLFTTDKRINRAERQIRREIVVHVSVHGAGDFAACLVLMSIVKDAERIGDNAKNLFDLSKLAPQKPAGPYTDDLGELKDRIVVLMTACQQVIEDNEKPESMQKEEATEVIRAAARIEDRCDEKIRGLIQGAGDPAMAPTFVLAYRYFKRVTSHIRNIASSVVQPVHKLDFTSKLAKEPPEA